MATSSRVKCILNLVLILQSTSVLSIFSPDSYYSYDRDNAYQYNLTGESMSTFQLIFSCIFKSLIYSFNSQTVQQNQQCMVHHAHTSTSTNLPEAQSSNMVASNHHSLCTNQVVLSSNLPSRQMILTQGLGSNQSLQLGNYFY